MTEPIGLIFMDMALNLIKTSVFLDNFFTLFSNGVPQVTSLHNLLNDFIFLIQYSGLDLFNFAVPWKLILSLTQDFWYIYIQTKHILKVNKSAQKFVWNQLLNIHWRNYIFVIFHVISLFETHLEELQIHLQNIETVCVFYGHVI